ncbi:MAG: hypothetical protein WKF96_17585 [Solirubrobacteraceae bacterium]
MRFEAEPLGFERDRASAGERIEDRRRIATRRSEDLCVRLGKQRLIARVLPLCEPRNDVVEAGALEPLGLLAREEIGV